MTGDLDMSIMVANVPDRYCVDEVADHTMALFLTCVRKTALLNASVKAGKWAVDLADHGSRGRSMAFSASATLPSFTARASASAGWKPTL
ncbi:MAG: hypothetical protein MZV63_33945 [Marinilabiliales bacterium]|nr:hypothetical protein [Marinilabiliales bacterium]